MIIRSVTVHIAAMLVVAAMLVGRAVAQSDGITSWREQDGRPKAQVPSEKELEQLLKSAKPRERFIDKKPGGVSPSGEGGPVSRGPPVVAPGNPLPGAKGK